MAFLPVPEMLQRPAGPLAVDRPSVSDTKASTGLMDGPFASAGHE